MLLSLLLFVSLQNDVHALDRKLSGSTISSLPANASEAQLKYENDRLKIALAQRYFTIDFLSFL